MTRIQPSPQAGFSLTEVLVSVFIFAIIGSISVGLMASSLSAQEQNSDVLDQAAMLDTTRALLREDLGQVVLRPARDAEGRTLTALFAGDVDGVDRSRFGDDARSGDTILTLTRRGRSNPGLLRPRSSLARVDYVLRDGNLVRRMMRHVDGSQPVDDGEIVLVAGVSDVELDFLVGAAWTRRVMLRSVQGEAGLPRAVRLRYNAPRLGSVEHVVLTSGAGG
ncbi:type II secretion system protein GspJ [Maricaulis sp.]|uniref:type II secretion system protein GspJ n=1 Tax=Maricaulis sp. TaxID=1486257 RepID=UPI003A926946